MQPVAETPDGPIARSRSTRSRATASSASSSAALFAFGAGVAQWSGARLDVAEARDADAAQCLSRREGLLSRCASARSSLDRWWASCGVTHRRACASRLGTWLTLVGGARAGLRAVLPRRGSIIASPCRPTGAPGIVNLINLPLSVCRRLWFAGGHAAEGAPRDRARWCPSTTSGQLALGAIGAVDDAERRCSTSPRCVACAVIFGALAWRAWRRSDEGVRHCTGQSTIG